MTTARSPRERMVYSAAQLLRARGVAATGVRDVVTRAEAPRGSFQHYFPGGKDQLVGEALMWSGRFAADRVRTYVDTAPRPTAAGLFAHLAQQWIDDFDRHGFERGCPIVATAADLAGTDAPVLKLVEAALAEWSAAIADALVTTGVARERADTLSTVVLSALEGAIVLARVRRSTAPLRAVVDELRPVLGE